MKFFIFENLKFVKYFYGTQRSTFLNNPFQDEKAKVSPTPSTIFSPVTSTKIEISHKNFLTFIFNTSFTLVWNFKVIPSVGPKSLNFNQGYPSKKGIFWQNPYKTDIMTTSFIEMLESPNFVQMTISAR